LPLQSNLFTRDSISLKQLIWENENNKAILSPKGKNDTITMDGKLDLVNRGSLNTAYCFSGGLLSIGWRFGYLRNIL
jgi:hypothetical protein